jgi:trans-2,3-dihydro-3-hydroxyanthranilate isomerase
MKRNYHIVDVFTRETYGGNPLAVLTDARGLSDAAMQTIAREFNLAETTFVLPPDDAAHTCRLRIFTPKMELPFAGHPTVGTACVLAMAGPGSGRTEMVFEEGVGPVAVVVDRSGDVPSATLTLQAGIQRPGSRPARGEMARVLSVAEADIVDAFFASAGTPFCFIELTDEAAVDRAFIDRQAWQEHLSQAWSPHVYFFCGDKRHGGRLYARMCAPAMGIEEDPATGAAAAALVGALAEAAPSSDEAVFQLSVLQGVAMGRRSEINAAARTRDGVTFEVSVGGSVASVAEGTIESPSPARGRD